MPGTVASLITVGVWYWAGLGKNNIFILACLLTGLFLVGVYTSGYVSCVVKKQDPSFVVIDEIMGMSLLLLVIPVGIYWYGGAFILFRMCDIIKFPPICIIEQKFSGGWGVMLDDITASVCAGFFLFLLVKIYQVVIVLA
jgi:phosphatidylglycerophosphatase A